MSAPISPSWLSFHVEPSETVADCYGRRLDDMLIQTLGPWARARRDAGDVQRAFFVRYAVDGRAHVRLRLEPTSDSTRRRLEHDLGRVASAVACRVTSIAYEPELDRYGGTVGLAVSENHFCRSSALALDVLAACRQGSEVDARRRLGRAILQATVFARASHPDEASALRFLATYADGYEQVLRQRVGSSRLVVASSGSAPRSVAVAVRRLLDTLDGLEEAEADRDSSAIVGPLGELAHWHDVTVRTSRRLAALPRSAGGSGSTAILRSLLHMHHNRLGLSIPQEIHLTRLVVVAAAAAADDDDDATRARGVAA